MIETEGDQRVMYCDSCAETLYHDASSPFTDLITEAKAEGWRMAKVDDMWIHTCPSCSEDKKNRSPWESQ